MSLTTNQPVAVCMTSKNWQSVARCFFKHNILHDDSVDVSQSRRCLLLEQHHVDVYF